MRITEYSDATLCLAKHSMHFGPPLPSAGEGLGVSGASTQPDCVTSVLRSASRAAFWELIQHGGMPRHPPPQPPGGGGGPVLGSWIKN